MSTNRLTCLLLLVAAVALQPALGQAIVSGRILNPKADEKIKLLRENPNVVANYQQFKDRGFTVYGVSLDQEKEPWVKAIAKDELTWHHVSDLKGWSSEASFAYNVTSIPANLLLDPNGVIVAKNLRGEALKAKLEEVFAQK